MDMIKTNIFFCSNLCFNPGGAGHTTGIYGKLIPNAKLLNHFQFRQLHMNQLESVLEQVPSEMPASGESKPLSAYEIELNVRNRDIRFIF